MMYNYLDAVKCDVLEAMDDLDIYEKLHHFGNRDDFETWLYDELLMWDSVTGNGSGSYTFSTWQAEENLCHNLDLLADANWDFGWNMDILKDGAEACDVAIRCYLLVDVIAEITEELFAEYFK